MTVVDRQPLEDAGPPTDPPAHDAGDGGGDDETPARGHLLRSWQLAVLAVALLFAGFAAADAWRTWRLPDAGSVDVGFLQDMRWHHDQVVQMSLTYLQKAESDAPSGPAIRLMAKEIVLGQQLQNGVMVELLRGFGQSTQNESGIAMAWMDMAIEISRMPGLATPEQLDALRAAPAGAEADLLYAELVLAHHEGGVHMAEDAARRASTDDVRTFARQMLEEQRTEIFELQRLISRA